MNNGLIFQRYLDLAKMLGVMFSPFVEVVVHDFKNPKKSIIAIYNGHITGRKIGDGASDLSIKRINGEVPDLITNYRNEAPDGQRLKSSTLAIKDDNNQILGSFALNMKTEYFSKVASILESLIETESPDFLPPKEDYTSLDSKERIHSKIDQFLITNSLTSLKLTPQNRDDLIDYLNQEKIFDLRSAIPITAQFLGVSRPTIYKSLNKSRQQ